VGVAHGDAEKRKKIIESTNEFVIINYDGIPAVSESLLNNNPFDLIVIDEANAYKNSQTKRWKLMRKVLKPTTWLWLLTGTPAAQSPVDAYGLGRLCVPDRAPQFFGDFQESVMKKVTLYKWEPRPEATQIVFDMLQPAIRYTKKECLDLPLMTYTTREAPLTPQQRKYYKELKNQMLMEAAGEEVSLANAASKMSKLLQISGGAVYSDSGAVIEFDVSNRLQAVQEVIEEASHKVLIFVPFRHTITTLHTYLLKAGIVNECIHGDVTVSERTNIFKRFQNDDSLRVLVIQPQAAAHGVTLTAADTIIWYSPVTSAETYLQANARIDRPGQRHPMTVVHIEGSPIERKLYGMLQNNIATHGRIVDLYKQEMDET
jgi:SNF2 family DNA or RNA helicase